jgi:D-alanyl-D-alanine endopeptidase (penicillin-binding protein 7)
MKKIFVSLLLCLPFFTYAGSHALYDFSSAAYVIENNRHEVRSIASITKLFTAITILNSGIDLNEKIKVDGKSKGYIPKGVYMTRMELMRAMLISSDNRAAETLANNYPGGFNNFIKAANSYAFSNALYNTQIVDSTGLLSGNQSTATDLIEFLSLIKNNSIIRSMASERNAVLNAKGKRAITINIRNTNPEMFVYDNILISKTGFTTPAGRCVLMLIEKNKDLFGVVVLGQRNVKSRSILVKELLSINHEPDLIPKIHGTLVFYHP